MPSDRATGDGGSAAAVPRHDPDRRARTPVNVATARAGAGRSGARTGETLIKFKILFGLHACDLLVC
jgi:hypothetical protein